MSHLGPQPGRLLLHAGALLTVAVMTLAPAPAQPGWTRLVCPDPAFAVEAPAGWRLEAVPGHGARLIPPGAEPVVEVVTWPALHLPATAEKAAAEHEGVLGRAVRYHRLRAEEMATGAGPALLVTGQANALGIDEISVFCAWASGDAHWVLGTFAPADEIDALRAEVLERMIRGFRPGAGPPVTPLLAPPESPVTYEPPVAVQPSEVPEPPALAEPADVPLPPLPEDVPAPPDIAEPHARPRPVPVTVEEPEVGELPTPPTAPSGNEGRPVAPEAGETPPSWVEHVDPSGFRLDLPAGWQASVEAGVIVAMPTTKLASTPVGTTGVPSLRDRTTGGGPRRAVIIWPTRGPDVGAAEALRLALARIGSIEPAGPPVSATDEPGLLIGSTTDGERIAASWAWDDGDGLLVALVAPAAHPDLRGGTMARIVASFRPALWPVAGTEGYQRVTGDAGRLTWELPEGWEARGGVIEEAGDLAIDIEATSGDGRMRVAWQQPLRPSFRALTPLLVSLGWHEGERYSTPEAGPALLIYRRRTPEELVVSILPARRADELHGVSVVAQSPGSAVAGLLAGEEPMGQAVLVRGESATGPRECLYLVATAQAPAPLSTTCWEGAALVADAPAGTLPQATAVLARMIESAEVTGVGQAALRDLVARARRALMDMPESMRSAGEDDELTGVIGPQAPTGARTWTMPAGALQHWSDQAAGGRLRQENVEGGPDDA